MERITYLSKQLTIFVDQIKLDESEDCTACLNLMNLRIALHV